MNIPDPAAAEREAMVKAQHDKAAYDEAARRAAFAAEQELVAPLAARTGALPARLETLRYLPVEDQPLYQRAADGSFVLGHVRINDDASLLEHADKIGRGITVLGAEETPASRAAQQQRQQEMEAKARKYLDEQERARIEAAKERAEAPLLAAKAKIEEQRAELNREHEARMRAMEIHNR